MQLVIGSFHSANSGLPCSFEHVPQVHGYVPSNPSISQPHSLPFPQARAVFLLLRMAVNIPLNFCWLRHSCKGCGSASFFRTAHFAGTKFGRVHYEDNGSNVHDENA